MDQKFHLLVLHKSNETVLIFRGELDIACAGALNDVVSLLIGDLSEVTYLDLEELDHLDAGGVSPLVRLANAAKKEGTRVVARRAKPMPAFVLGLTSIEFEDQAARPKTTERPPVLTPSAASTVRPGSAGRPQVVLSRSTDGHQRPMMTVA